jgi:hypothetical protein
LIVETVILFAEFLRELVLYQALGFGDGAFGLKAISEIWYSARGYSKVSVSTKTSLANAETLLAKSDLELEFGGAV